MILMSLQVYSDLEVAFVISEDENIFQALSRTVELLEGNTALVTQNYYGCLFNELLSFQLADRRLPQMVCHSLLLFFIYCEMPLGFPCSGTVNLALMNLLI